ncbi:MAG: aspartate-semialdehyde dehydrogenase [Verrucomicrobia bacterium GWF2_51_19]|nr:MAG: aspartate-semialdehyde dehydrogenase [Verrucomicrobia bacterium GWF2_51_19]
MHRSSNYAIVGATGLVGQELLKLLTKDGQNNIRLAASEASLGQSYLLNGRQWVVERLSADFFKDVAVAFFCASKYVSLEWVPIALECGCTCIDNSSAYRHAPSVPLVIPEINGHLLRDQPQLIANPNCSTLITLMALYPLHKAFGLKRFWASTYQAVSGAGRLGLQELDDQVQAAASGHSPLPHQAFSAPIAFNAIPSIGDFCHSGYTTEEEKMLHESRKILGLSTLRVSTTCVRIPIRRAHSIAISAEFEQLIDLDVAKEALRAAPGIEVLDLPKVPTPLAFSSRTKCGVGRLRIDSALENGLSLWVSGDQLLKGAAFNAFQLSQKMGPK